MMKFIVKGKYSGNESDLPTRHVPGSTQFKEVESVSQLSKLASVISLLILAVLFLIIGYVSAKADYPFMDHPIQLIFGALLSCLVFIPHEFLHAICFKQDVEFYENLSQGMLFVVGTEDMSKARFIFMSLLPTIVFGFIPYISYLFDPTLLFCGVFGAMNIASGAGDFYNVYNAITQVPAHALIYMSGLHSFWYLPETSNSHQN
ncbi:DUF3267 domain-containing protein [Ileibacterium valens]|uniref:DUF3267 domain-containing protein n=2 Tax=Ileibacterium valens TaxID=1862668 RepID=UPI00259AF1FD|nr:DUF3267 domain-containing protein [Ileibacterium valens]